jgi:hypothetical protein
MLKHIEADATKLNYMYHSKTSLSSATRSTAEYKVHRAGLADTS